MKQTENYQFKLIETTDSFSPEAINANTQAIEEKFLAMAGQGRVAAGVYTGDGTFGPAHPCQLEFEFQPAAVFLFKCAEPFGTSGNCVIMVREQPTARYDNSVTMNLAWTPKGVKWHTTGSIPHYQMNVSGVQYLYIAIG